ncbi:hypothetical protein [Streptomyces sp. S1D4-20]|uniref:hypothetical protein n=1 Tax=Streptomyces sp. S1D4-20 TaxID=2594462 RepID=UPI00116460DD|nr:hypothetical protein [Streptomyces sp. S1D4-20]QDN58712.1 hypothetical protein FNV67_28395 [Streptomyces sp. S1D4-20]
MNDEQPQLAADPETIRAWLDTAFSHATGQLSIAAGFGAKLEYDFFPTTEAGRAAAVEYAVRLDRRKPQGIYFQSTTVAARPPKGRGGEAAAYDLTHLWADGDYGTLGHKPSLDDLPAPPDAESVAKVVAESPLPEPTGWTESGGGYNPVWLLDEAFPIESDDDRARVKDLTVGVQTILGAQAYQYGWSWDTEVSNLDRLMKLPGTVNRKQDCPERMARMGAGSGVLYSLAELAAIIVEHAPAAQEIVDQANREKQERKAQRKGEPIAPPRSERPAGLHTGDGPLSVLADMQTFGDILEPEGWTFTGQSGGWEQWLRPTASGDAPSSAYSLKCNDHVAVNWSERSDLPVGRLPSGRKLTIGTLWSHLHYAGNTSEAARDIMRAAAGRPARGAAGRLSPAILAEVKRRCMPDEPIGRDDEASLRALIADDPWDGPQDEPAEDEPAKVPPTQIQLEFWESRESLASIRRLAHSKLLPADTTLAAIMTRVSGAIPHTFTAKSPMGHASLNLAAAMIGGPSAGKSQSARAARETFPTPDRLQGRDGLPIGSGEGMTEVFIGLQEQETGEVKKGPGGTETPVVVQVRTQIHHNAFFYVDEGKSIGDLEERGGSTLGETIRRAAMGEALGQTNASQDRKRFVAPMSYAMGVLVGLQPSIASTLLKDAGTGTPQRFLWLWARDVTIPDEVVEHAGVIDVPAINDPSYGGTVVFEVPGRVAADMRAKRLHAVRTGGADTDEINGHEPVMKMKFAALLAIIDGRYHMTMDDWRLAEMLWATSCAVRDELIGLAAREATAARRAAEDAEIDLAARKEEALDKAAMRREARLKKVLEHLAHAGGRMSRTDLIQKFHSRYRGELPDVIERGVAKGVLRAVEEDGDWWVHAAA